MKRSRCEQVSVAGDGLSPPERVCSLLRDIQWETNCSTLSLQRFLDSLRGELGEAVRQCKTSGFDLPRSAKFADKIMQQTVCVDLLANAHSHFSRLASNVYTCTDVSDKTVTQFGERQTFATSARNVERTVSIAEKHESMSFGFLLLNGLRVY